MHICASCRVLAYSSRPITHSSSINVMPEIQSKPNNHQFDRRLSSALSSPVALHARRHTFEQGHHREIRYSNDGVCGVR